MKRSLIAIAILSFGLSACSKNTPTSPTPDSEATFTATLLPSNELPPVTNADATGSGTVTITLHVNRDAGGGITGGTADFSATFTGFPAGTALTGAHIHPGFSASNGGVAVSTGITAGEVTMPAGSGSLNKTGVPVSADNTAAIMATPQGFYFNIHTAANPCGAARGQLTRVQ
jgi:CHRD domain